MGLISDTAYNNYLTAYTPKEQSPINTHKKSELRGVYNSIVKLNKESPWYLPTTSKDTQQYAIDLKENANDLHNVIAQLGGLDEDGLLHKKSAYSSDNNIATATYIGPPPKDTDSLNFTLEVKTLASGQENLGKYLPDSDVRLRPNTYSFDISINEMNYEFQFSISDDETNKEVQTRLARLINNSGIGIKANVTEAEGKTALKLSSESQGKPAGKDYIFKISDENTSKASGTVDYFGLDYTSKAPTNATFLVNGEDYSASSNRFTVGKAFNVHLTGVSPEDQPITIGLKTDIDSLTDNISNLIEGYNDFMKTATSYNDSQSKSRQLVNEMKGIALRFGTSMESMGLSMQDDGTLEIDKSLLRQAALSSEDSDATFGYLKNFTTALLNKSEEVSINPMNYVEKTVVAYKNPGHNFASPYTMSAYSGMMFNGYC